MQVQVNVPSIIEGHDQLAARVISVVENAVSRFSDRITSVEVHLSDRSSAKRSQHDKRCMMEARLEGRGRTAVTHVAATVGEAVDGAADKLRRSIESNLGFLHDDHPGAGDHQREVNDDLERRGAERWEDEGGSL